MKKSTNIALTILLIFLVLGIVVYFRTSLHESARNAPTQAEHDRAVLDLSTRLKSLADQIKLLQGQNECRTNQECRIVGIGAPVCDRYKNFVIYSITGVDEPALLQKVQEFNEAHKDMTNLSTSPGSCGTKPSPIQCIGGRCAPVQP